MTVGSAIGDMCGRMGADMIGSVNGKTYAFVDRNLPLAPGGINVRVSWGEQRRVWMTGTGQVGFSSGKVPYVCAVIEGGDSTGKVIVERLWERRSGKISGVVTFRQPASGEADLRVAVRLR